MGGKADHRELNFANATVTQQSNRKRTGLVWGEN